MFSITSNQAQGVIEKLGDPYTNIFYINQKNLEENLDN
jgi:hypothetical protein